jgi:hypothetical protein
VRIEVIRTGGFTGIERRAVLDTAGRPDAPHLDSLARASLTPSPHPSPPAPDGFRYELHIDATTLHCTDPHLTPSQRELIQAVLHEGA